MNNYIAAFSILVKDYDEAIKFYKEVLDFDLLEDTSLSQTKRWVRMAPKGAIETCIILAKATNDQQLNAIGKQTGGRVGFFLHTNDFDLFYERLLAHKVKIVRPKTVEPHGVVSVFEDLYGNLWDLIQPSQK